MKKYIFDFKDKILGRQCSKISKIIIESYNLRIDFIILIKNYRKFIINVNKKKNVFFYKHTGFPGGLKKIYTHRLKKKKVIEKYLKGMLPKNKISKFYFKKIIYLK